MKPRGRTACPSRPKDTYGCILDSQTTGRRLIQCVSSAVAPPDQHMLVRVVRHAEHASTAAYRTCEVLCTEVNAEPLETAHYPHAQRDCPIRWRWKTDIPVNRCQPPLSVSGRQQLNVAEQLPCLVLTQGLTRACTMTTGDVPPPPAFRCDPVEHSQSLSKDNFTTHRWYPSVLLQILPDSALQNTSFPLLHQKQLEANPSDLDHLACPSIAMHARQDASTGTYSRPYSAGHIGVSLPSQSSLTYASCTHSQPLL